ncbi:uncharacterized protein LOC114126897 [Aphis gossypii]|uniref:Uncharacterized protein n=1 Tax=Aphis gossypii TaxID=80765 RepID=A0A9P0IPB9_APHGO|nr:uncharacterized protein LOC114126897 [Aphis gossypii]CAH1711492.1 unnamed protein product [Aphis gossypii]
MNINYIQGKVILIVLACVLHANYGKTGKLKSKNQLEKSPSSSKNKNHEVSLKDPKNDPIEKMLLKIATIIQGCIDERTMNNKQFKTKLDDLYKDIVKDPVNESIVEHMKKVKNIKKKYDEDVKLLKIMNLGETLKNKPKSKSFNKSDKK